MSSIETWSQSDLDYLVTNYPLISNAKIAKHLGRTPSAIATKAFRMKLVRPGRNNAGQFKRQHNRTKSSQVNSIIEISSGSYPVLLIKTERGWLKAHRVIWENSNGPIPAGYAVGFRDGNSRNIELSNLICMSKADIIKFHAAAKRNRPKTDRVPRVRKHKQEPQQLSMVAKAMIELKNSGLIRVLDKEKNCEYWMTAAQKAKYDEKQRLKQQEENDNGK